MKVNKLLHVSGVILCRRKIERRSNSKMLGRGSKVGCRPGLIGNRMLDQRTKRCESKPGRYLGRMDSGRGNSQCKGPKVGLCRGIQEMAKDHCSSVEEMWREQCKMKPKS